MELSSVIHEPKSALCYTYDASTLHLRIKTKKEDIKAVTLIAADPFNWKPSSENPQVWEFALETMQHIEMKKEGVTALHDCWFAELTGMVWGRVKYGFVLDDGTQKCFAGCHDFTLLPDDWTPPADHTNYFNYPYMLEEDVYKAPEWVQETVWYQIFPDRFNRGGEEEGNDVLPWGSDDRDGYDTKFGGNLQGITEKLDYIRDLGCGGIYFTPIFESPSSHKYDTKDYFKIDPAFGDNERFGELVREAHNRGIKVMLDAVFNHCGYEHPFWQDVVKNGKASRYFDYFYIMDPEKPVASDPSCPGPHYLGKNLNYRTFGFAENMPKWNTAHPEVREYLIGAAEYWTKEFGVDGWRLDVSNEVSHDFWREFRKRMKAINPDLYILGENWLNSNPWLLGDQFDAVMNYEFTSPVTRFFGTNHKNQEPYSAREFVQAVGQLLVSYPKNVTQNLFNLLDSHDTARILTICGDDPERAKLAYVFQLVYPGSPSIYYGGEIALGGDEQHNRQCMPWEEEKQNLELRGLIQTLIRLRKEHPAFRAPDIEWLEVDESTNTLIFKKESGGETLYVLLHNSGNPAEISLPAEIAERPLVDLVSGEKAARAQTVYLEPFAFRLWDGGTGE